MAKDSDLLLAKSTQTMETSIVINKTVRNDRQVMTSLEIAELTGKQHKNLMRDIRNMEPAWEKVQGLKFELSSRRRTSWAC